MPSRPHTHAVFCIGVVTEEKRLMSEPPGTAGDFDYNKSTVKINRTVDFFIAAYRYDRGKEMK